MAQYTPSESLFIVRRGYASKEPLSAQLFEQPDVWGVGLEYKPKEQAMTFQNNDPNRPTNLNPNLSRPASNNRSTTSNWGIPVVIAAAVIIGGLFLYNSMGNHNMTTANNNRPVTNSAPITNNAPPVQTPAPTPSQAPLTTAPKQ